MKFLNDIDVNGNRVRNLPSPLANDEPITLQYFIANSTAGLTKLKWITSVSQLPTAISGNITLVANTAYYWDGGTHTLSDTLTFGNNVFFGLGRTLTTISYSGVGTFINGINTNVHIQDLEISAPTGTLFNLSNTVTQTTLLRHMRVNSCVSMGTISSGTVILDFIRITSCGTGILISGSTGVVIIDNSTIEAMSGGAGSYGVRIANGTTGTFFRCTSSSFTVATGHFGLDIAGTYTLTIEGTVAGCDFSGAGTRLNGVNGGTAGWNIMFGSNFGIAGLQYVHLNLTTTDATLTGSATFVDGGSVRALSLSASNYDQFATTVQARVSAKFSTGGGTIQVGVRDNTTSTNLGGLSAVTSGTDVVIQSSFVTITGGNEITGYYVRAGGGLASTRKSVEITLKIY